MYKSLRAGFPAACGVGLVDERECIDKSHNVTVLMYHVVFPAKYRRAVFSAGVDEVLKDVCLEIVRRYRIKFPEIGANKEHVRFWVQSLSKYSVTRIVTVLKSITGREVFR
jgi:REP element-mobilizing transposase RayT